MPELGCWYSQVSRSSAGPVLALKGLKISNATAGFKVGDEDEK